MQKLKDASLAHSIELLKGGDVVAIPTETVYGLAGDITQQAAIQKIFEIKERPSFDPLIVHVSDGKKAQELSKNWNSLADSLSRAFWPGPLTLVVEKNDLVSDLITSGKASVALRVPSHPICLELLQHFSGLAAPSANKFGKLSPGSAEMVRRVFQEKVFVLDGGDCSVGIESTIIQILSSHEIALLRPGMIITAQIEKVLREDGLTISWVKRNEIMPGTLSSHYCPSKPFRLAFHGSSKKIQETKLELPDDPFQAARLFYAGLFRLQNNPAVKSIVLQWKKEWSGEAWDAILNRASKAATKSHN